jgi:hypothetical protein
VHIPAYKAGQSLKKMKSKMEYRKQKQQARAWAIRYLVECLHTEPTDEAIREYARARRRELKKFHRLRGHMLG